MEQTLGIIGGVSYARHMPYLRGVYRSVKAHMEKFRKFLWDNVVDSSRYDENEFCYSALFHKNSGSGQFFTNKQLIVSLLDFFTGGSGTVAKTMSFSLLFMLHYPNAQERVRNEVQAVLDDEISLRHAPSMPYTEAFLLEVTFYRYLMT